MRRDIRVLKPRVKADGHVAGALDATGTASRCVVFAVGGPCKDAREDSPGPDSVGAAAV